MRKMVVGRGKRNERTPKRPRDKKVKWTSISIYVDDETGEVLSKKAFAKEYYIVSKSIIKKLENETAGIVSITNRCRKSRQLELFK